MKKILENGIPAGNWENKYHSKNFIINYLMDNFKNSIYELLKNKKDDIDSFVECGCGEGEVTRFIYNLFDNIDAKGFDFSEEIINIAKKNNEDINIEFKRDSIYEIDSSYKSDLVICCEVLEHLDNPDIALKNMKNLNAKYYLFSVPNEPIWRILNFLRGKYLKNLGNTPGHINHWNSRKFKKLIMDNGFKILEINSPFPWIMLLAKIK